MDTRRFTLDDQMAFADLSGDHNPLHVDPIAARRLLFGAPAVHGIHGLLWGMDRWLRTGDETIGLRSVKATFRRPIRIDEDVACFLPPGPDGQVQVDLFTGGVVATSAKVAWGAAAGPFPEPDSAGFPAQRKPKVQSIHEAKGLTGSLPLHLNREAASRLLPSLVQRLSSREIAQLLATTRLVGMECPGHHSVYSSLDLTFSDASEGTTDLRYEVAKLDERFGLVVLRVESVGLTGTISAFFRPPPREQPGYSVLQALVGDAEFAAQRALVIGGSRGLGEVTAKLLAAGGAQVRITYHQSVEDARRVADDIATGGGDTEGLFFDVLDVHADITELLEKGWSPTHLYYFATPFIASSPAGSFSAAQFRAFCDYYVLGFERVIRRLVPVGLQAALFPSSTYVEELPVNLAEYAAAKMAGETLCAILKKTYPGIDISTPRLPRLTTDQTASFMPGDEQDPAPILLEHLRRLHRSSAD